MGKIFYISDLHISHKNCISFDNRPFTSTKDMDEAIIKNWNNTVTDEDTVYILGDMFWCNTQKAIEILKSLKGTKILIKGNHDDCRDAEFRSYFKYIKDMDEVYDNGRKVILCHYPIPCFKNHFYGWFHLCGHTHISFEHNMMENDKFEIKALYDRPCNMYNVGCMHPWMNYTPRTLSEIISGYEQYLASTKSEEQVEAGGLRPCPYCGGSDIRYSIKSTTLQFKKAYHASMYCWDCNSYGPRVLYKSDEHRYDVEHNENLRKQAESLWNRRG
jgi:calcineurin-like phosphoesterase family protein